MRRKSIRRDCSCDALGGNVWGTTPAEPVFNPAALACTNGQITAIAIIGGVQMPKRSIDDVYATCVPRLSFWS